MAIKHCEKKSNFTNDSEQRGWGYDYLVAGNADAVDDGLILWTGTLDDVFRDLA